MKKKYVRLLALLLTIVMLVGISACSSTNEQPTTEGATGGGEATGGSNNTGGGNNTSGGNNTGSGGNTDSGGNTGSNTGNGGNAGSGGDSGSGNSGTEPTGPANPERYGGVLNAVYGQSFDNLDPHKTTGWISVWWAQNVFETPLTRDASGNLQPGVCDFEVSEDRLTLKMWVREGVTFHDGTPCTIEDVVASLARSGVSVAQVRDFFIGLIDTCVIEGDVVTYKFTEYSQNTLIYISGFQIWSAIMKKEICDKYGDDPITDYRDVIGTGPYMLTAVEPGVMYTVDRFDGYVPVPEGKTGMAAPKMAYMDRINLWGHNEEATSVMALMAGTYDVIDSTMAYADMLSGSFEPYPDHRTDLAYIAFNTKSDRPVNDPNLRKAIAAVLDYEAIMKFMSEGMYIMDSSPTGDRYYSDKFNKADYWGPENLALARQYLEASSYNNEELVILSSTSSSVAQIGPIVQAQLEKIGIKSTIEYLDAAAFSATYTDNSNPYDFVWLLSAVESRSPALLVANVRTVFWGSERKDALLRAIGSEIAGSAAATAAWDELIDLWVDECPIINLGRQVASNWWHNPDLVINMREDAEWTYFYDAYWKNPGDHMG